MVREYHKWFSPALGRDMELLVFGHAGAPVLVFPTREGRFFDYENWGLVGAATEHIESGRLRLFCVDSVDAEAFTVDAVRRANASRAPDNTNDTSSTRSSLSPVRRIRPRPLWRTAAASALITR